MNNKKESADVVFIQSLVRTLRKRKKFLISSIPAVLLVVILLQGIYTIPVNERGALFLFGKLQNDNIAPGIHFKLPGPIQTLQVMNIEEIRSMKMVKEIKGAIPIITGDENIIQIGIAVQYKITEYDNYLRGPENWEQILNMAATACLTELIAGMEVDEVLTTGKSLIQARLLLKTQKLLKNYKAGITIFSVTIENIKPPTECQDSFRMVSNARNERAEKINIAQSNRNRRLSTARGEAVSTILQAESEAEEMIKKSMGESYRYQALLREYRKAEEYTVTDFYLNSMENIIDKSEILLLNSKNTGTIDLNHFLQQNTGTTAAEFRQPPAGESKTTASLAVAAPTVSSLSPPTAVPAAAATAEPQSRIDQVIKIQNQETEVRRVHPPVRR